MSLEVNDENRGVCLGGKHSSSDNIFALEQPTGRPSILRQTENLPSNAAPRGMKVCFQTPRRDPVTKRILSPSKSAKMSNLDECTKALQYLTLETSSPMPQEATQQPQQPQQEPSTYPDDHMPIQSKGGYQLDFDNLDDFNPFQGSNKMILSPFNPAPVHTQPLNPAARSTSEEPRKVEAALDETLPFNPSLENSLVNVTIDCSLTDSGVVTVAKVEEQDLYAATPEEKQPAETLLSTNPDHVTGVSVEDSPLLSKGSYQLDFDNLDAINPFQTGGSKIQNSPLVVRKEPEEEQKPVEGAGISEEVPEVSVEREAKPSTAVAPVSTSTDQPPAGDPQPAAAPVKDAPVKLEFGFDDDDKVKRKPPPRKFGKRPSGVKPKETKPTSARKPPAEVPAAAEEEVLLPKGSYSFDLEKFDNPDFNPFGTNVKMNNSPACSKKPVEPERTSVPVEEEKKEKEAVCVEQSEPTSKDAAAPDASSNHKEALPLGSESTPQSDLVDFLSQDIFVPGTTFMANDFDGQIDYLEQFGSSFKESLLRKQSLYLKFDPLLVESPVKPAGPAAQSHAPLPTALVLPFEAPLAEEKTSGPVKEGVGLLDVETPSLVPPSIQPPEDAIIEVLKYSQLDMDAAIASMQAEAKEKDEQWSVKYKKLLDNDQEMRKIVAEFELVIAKMMADQEQEKMNAQAKINEALQEKEQVSRDLCAMERSFSDLFKRLEKYKEVIEGYKKNEETLKAFAQDYLERIKKEELRYQTLKAHAEEKINQANEEIAEVRSKYKAEVSALQAQLRRAELRLHSMEKTLEQKERELDEVTKLCDELISKVQKG